MRYHHQTQSGIEKSKTILFCGDVCTIWASTLVGRMSWMLNEMLDITFSEKKRSACTNSSIAV